MTTGLGLAFALFAVLFIGCFAGSYWLAEKVTSWFAVHILGGAVVFWGHIFAVRGSEYERQFTFVKKAKKKHPAYYVQNIVLALLYYGTAIAVFWFVLSGLIVLFAKFIIG